MAIADKLRILARRVKKWLWVRPLVACALSVAAMIIAKTADHVGLGQSIPQVATDSLVALLTIMGSSMLMIATFAVGSMISAFTSASVSATPRAFPLIIADDLSQNALSIFVGAFIFSLVALTAIKNHFFQESGLFVLFSLTALVLGAVILTFILWVDRISRLGRLGASTEKVEDAAAAAMKGRKAAPALRGVPARRRLPQGQAVCSANVGYVQHINIATLEKFAERIQGWVAVAALPGTFVAPGHPLAYVDRDAGGKAMNDLEEIACAFEIGRNRLFDEDPRFGLVVLSEIADKALSSGINDPGTAISIIGSLVRLFVLWTEPVDDAPEPEYHRVEVPLLSVRDMFDDAFTPIARDGAGMLEVMICLQKGLDLLSKSGDTTMHEAALEHSRLAFSLAEKELALPEHVALVREAAQFSRENHQMPERASSRETCE